MRWGGRLTCKWMYIVLGTIVIFSAMSCTSSSWSIGSAEAKVEATSESWSLIFEPDSEDLPFFRAIAADQDLELQSCKSQVDCQKPHFLRGLASLYINKNLAASHFRRVITAKPSSRLAVESRFWLWLLDMLHSPNGEIQQSTIDMARRLTREIVDREFLVYDLVSKLEHSSIESLQQEIVERDKKIEDLNQAVASLTKQISQLKKEPSIRLSLQKELDASEKKVEELMSQLEALRRIDQELKKKTPPTRPSEELTPSSEIDTEPSN